MTITAIKKLVITSFFVAGIVYFFLYFQQPSDKKSLPNENISQVNKKKIDGGLDSLKFSSRENIKKTYYKVELLPSSKTPWSILRNELLPRAEGGDKDAIEQLYNDTLQCVNYFDLKTRMDDILSIYKGPEVSASTLKAYDERLAEIKDKLAESADMCASVSREEIDNSLMTIIKFEADQGDGIAQACYLNGSIFGAFSSQSDNVKSDYLKNSETYIRNGINSGNWPILNNLALAFGASPNNGWLGGIVKQDALAEYSLLLVEKYGMDASRLSGSNSLGPFVNLDGALDALKENNAFSPEQIRQAESWAKSTYSDSFFGVPFPADISGSCPGQIIGTL